MEDISKNGKGARRIIDAHSVPHWKVPKSVLACAAADVIDGHAVLQNPTLRLVAAAFGVSVTSVVNALHLTPAQRDSVRRGLRPLTLPDATPKALPPPVSPEQRLAGVVAELGVPGTFDALVSMSAVEQQKLLSN
jgi:hypothetical protein